MSAEAAAYSRMWRRTEKGRAHTARMIERMNAHRAAIALETPAERADRLNRQRRAAVARCERAIARVESLLEKHRSRLRKLTGGVA